MMMMIVVVVVIVVSVAVFSDSRSRRRRSIVECCPSDFGRTQLGCRRRRRCRRIRFGRIGRGVGIRFHRQQSERQCAEILVGVDSAHGSLASSTRRRRIGRFVVVVVVVVVNCTTGSFLVRIETPHGMVPRHASIDKGSAKGSALGMVRSWGQQCGRRGPTGTPRSRAFRIVLLLLLLPLLVGTVYRHAVRIRPTIVPAIVGRG